MTVSERTVAYRVEVLQTLDKRGTLEQETVQVSRAELEQERRHLVGRLQQLNRLLGYPPLLTGKEQRRQACAE